MTEHRLLLSRCQLGRATIRGSGMRYGTVWRCACDQERHQINVAPSRGGNRDARMAWRQHVELADRAEGKT